MQDWEKGFIKNSSIPLPNGGDTHIHPFGPGEQDFTVTTRIPVGNGTTVEIHDNPLNPGNKKTNNFKIR